MDAAISYIAELPGIWEQDFTIFQSHEAAEGKPCTCGKDTEGHNPGCKHALNVTWYDATWEVAKGWCRCGEIHIVDNNRGDIMYHDNGTPIVLGFGYTRAARLPAEKGDWFKALVKTFIGQTKYQPDEWEHSGQKEEQDNDVPTIGSVTLCPRHGVMLKKVEPKAPVPKAKGPGKLFRDIRQYREDRQWSGKKDYTQEPHRERIGNTRPTPRLHSVFGCKSPDAWEEIKKQTDLSAAVDIAVEWALKYNQSLERREDKRKVSEKPPRFVRKGVRNALIDNWRATDSRKHLPLQSWGEEEDRGRERKAQLGPWRPPQPDETPVEPPRYSRAAMVARLEKRKVRVRPTDSMAELREADSHWDHLKGWDWRPNPTPRYERAAKIHKAIRASVPEDSWLRRYHDSRLSFRDLAEDHGMSATTVRRRVQDEETIFRLAITPQPAVEHMKLGQDFYSWHGVWFGKVSQAEQLAGIGTTDSAETLEEARRQARLWEGPWTNARPEERRVGLPPLPPPTAWEEAIRSHIQWLGLDLVLGVRRSQALALAA